MIAANGSKSCGAAIPRPAARFTRLPAVEQVQPTSGDVVPVEVAPHLDVRVAVEPVDVDLSVTVADVDEDRTVGHLLELLRAQYPVEPGSGHDDARPCRAASSSGGDAAAVVLGLDRSHGVEIDDRDTRPQVAGAQCDPLPHGSEPDDDDLAPVERQASDSVNAGHVSTPTW